MRHNIAKWLSASLILLSILSCKKEKGVLDDMDSGKFDFVCIWEDNGNKDTLAGEVSGPDGSSPNYYFMVKQELNTNNSLKDFKVGYYSKIINQPFSAGGLLNAKITSEEHDADHLFITFQNNDSSLGPIVTGTFKLTRKE